MSNFSSQVKATLTKSEAKLNSLSKSQLAAVYAASFAVGGAIGWIVTRRLTRS
jgi:hypothetical protein